MCSCFSQTYLYSKMERAFTETNLCTDQIGKSMWVNDVLTSTLSQHSLAKSTEHKEIHFGLSAFYGWLSFILATVVASCNHKA